MGGRRGGASWGSVIFVGARDLINEKLLTLCMVLSVAAVLAPIMVLASVKIGFVDRLRSEFIQDPSFREIRPADADLRNTDFFASVRQWPGVRYAMPSVMMVPREVSFYYSGDGKIRAGAARLVPSDALDPVLAQLVGNPPNGAEVVISSDVADGAGLKSGSKMTLTIDRVEGGKRSRVELQVTVAGIVPALPLPTILADPAIDRAVENYRAGIAVPDRGWAGVASTPKQSFGSMVLLTRSPLTEVRSSDLRIHLGAREVVEAAPNALQKAFGLAATNPPPNDRWNLGYMLAKAVGRFGGEDLDDAASLLHNIEALAIGANPPLPATVLGKPVTLAGPDPRLFTGLDPPTVDWQVGPHSSYAFNAGVLLPRDLEKDWRDQGSKAPLRIEISAPADWATKALSIDARVLGSWSGDEALISPSLLAMIYRGAKVPIAFDPTSGTIVEQSTGYRGFRVIADSIDDVPRLAQRFVDLGVPVHTKSDQILRLQRLDRSLNILVAIVSAVALGGGFAILSASFFANVQRKRIDYAMLRLIGMPKGLIFRIPITQACLIACAGFVLSSLLYFLVSRLLNGIIAAQVGFEGQLSKLNAWHFVLVFVFVVLGSCVASLAASREATRIDPAQALRAV
jgi:putative ABC transport system permease protein